MNCAEMYRLLKPTSIAVLMAAVCCAVLSIGTARSQERASVEYKIKAAYLLNFAKFVEWPTNKFATRTTPIKVGVLGKDPFGADLERTMAGRAIDGRKFEIVRVDEADDARSCHIVFVSSSERRSFAKIVETLHKNNVLTVGEHDQFVQQGGVIRFYLYDDARRSEVTVRFEINGAAAERAGLHISSKLMQIAKPPDQP